MGSTFATAVPSGRLPSADAGSDWIVTHIPSRCRFMALGPGNGGGHLPGRMRRFHEGAHENRGHRAQRDADHHRLRHHDHTRFRVSLRLHREVWARLDRVVFILTGRKHLANTAGIVQRHRYRLAGPAYRLGARLMQHRGPLPGTAQPPLSAAPNTGGGGTAGLQDTLLLVLGGAAVLAGAGSIAYRRKVIKNR